MVKSTNSGAKRTRFNNQLCHLPCDISYPNSLNAYLLIYQIKVIPLYFTASLVAQWYRIQLPMQESIPGLGRPPWRRKWQPTPVFLPGKFHGQGSLMGYKSMESQRVGHNLVTIQQYLLYRAIVRIEKINGKKDNKGESHEFVVVISRSRHLNSLCPFLYL